MFFFSAYFFFYFFSKCIFQRCLRNVIFNVFLQYVCVAVLTRDDTYDFLYVFLFVRINPKESVRKTRAAPIELQGERPIEPRSSSRAPRGASETPAQLLENASWPSERPAQLLQRSNGKVRETLVVSRKLEWERQRGTRFSYIQKKKRRTWRGKGTGRVGGGAREGGRARKERKVV